jgi:hypothetical protein
MKFHPLILVLARDIMKLCQKSAGKPIWLISNNILLVDQSCEDHTIIVPIVERCIRGNQTYNDTSDQSVESNLTCSAHTAHTSQIARQVYRSIFLGDIRTCLILHRILLGLFCRFIPPSAILFQEHMDIGYCWISLIYLKLFHQWSRNAFLYWHVIFIPWLLYEEVAFERCYSEKCHLHVLAWILFLVIFLLI